MIFADPLPFTDALARLAAKKLMPTHLSSAELREMDADLLQRSLFMARNPKAQILQSLKDGLGELLDGVENVATVRARLQDHFDRLGYDPQSGFGDADDAGIPPAERGSLRDLSSDRRLNLVLETNMRQVANAAYEKAGQSDFALFAFPAYELVRIYVRQVPRGEKIVKGEIVADPGNDWPSRWEQSGGQFFGDGRMIARKDDPVWEQLGNRDLFPDALGAPRPPFAFNSGYGWTEIAREEAIELGVIDEDTDIQGSTVEMNEGMEIAADFDPEFLAALKQDLDIAVANGRARLEASR